MLQSVPGYFSLPLAPPTGNKEKYGWLARLLQEVIESEREYVRRLQMATEVSSRPEIRSSSAVLHGNSGFY